MSILEWVTLITAIWGAVTGTIALILKIREDIGDNPNLLIQPEFEYSGFELPLDVMYLKVTVTNAGHRPTTLDSAYVLFRPRKIWTRLAWKINGKGKVWLNTSNRFEQPLAEGRHVDFRFLPKDIWKPDGLDMVDIVQIIVKDKAGREWKSKKEFGQKRLKTNAAARTIETKDLKTENHAKEFGIRLCYINKVYDLRYRYLTGNSWKYHFDNFNNLSDAQKAYKFFLSKGEKFIAGELENLED